ncbi:MAG: dephospho-CoA kinase [Thermoguttaceae bacterium]
MEIYGIIGGIGSGKSTVAQQFVELFGQDCVKILSADNVGHEVLLLDAVKNEAKKRWGDVIFNTSGEIDRKKLAEIVFAPNETAKAERRFLEELTHDRIADICLEKVEEYRNNNVKIVILDAPLLLETKWSRFVTKIIFVDTPEAARLEHVKQRGWSLEELRNREKAQLSLDEKRARADICIENYDSLETLKEKILKIGEQGTCRPGVTLRVK